jgi:hypothetical protein
VPVLAEIGEYPSLLTFLLEPLESSLEALVLVNNDFGQSR